MFYDLEDPQAVVAEIADVLAEDGLWIMELHYLPAMLAMNSFDAIVHEHLEYYSLAVLERMLGAVGLEVVRGRDQRHERRLGAALHPPPRPLHSRARGTPRRCRRCGCASSSSRSTTTSRTRASPPPPRRSATSSSGLCRRLAAEGRDIHVYGASTKGNTILQYCGLDASVIPYAADRNPDKWGSETIGTGIPIIGEEESRAMNPDYYLALPWHFLEEFLEREQEFLGRGGRFIVPLPEVRIVP